jgi:hypothetical protein
MPSTPGALPLLTLRLCARFDGPAPTALHAAEAWRGAIKGALRRHAEDLLDELIRPEAVARNAGAAAAPTNQTTPGYVLRVEWDERGAPEPMRSEQRVRITFFGRAGLFALPVMYALLQDAAEPGIGRRQRPFAMPQLQSFDPAHGWRDLRLAVKAEDMLGHAWTHAYEAPAALRAAERCNVLLRFTTRLVFEVNGQPLAEPPTLQQLVLSLCARCNRLAEVWGTGVAYDAQAQKRLAAAAGTAHLEPDSAMRLEQRRLSSGHQRLHYASDGPAGLFLYSLPGAAACELLPLLHLGQWLHVGAQTTAGLGHYELLLGIA